MIEITKKQTRPNINTPFHFELNLGSDEHRKYIYTAYIKTGKLIKSTKVMSEDGLTVYLVSVWNSEEDFLELIVDDKYLSGPVSVAYDLANDIKTAVTSRRF